MSDYILTCYTSYDDSLAHYGAKGQKWGERRYQNKDGSLTPLGRAHYYPNAGKKPLGQKLKDRAEAKRARKMIAKEAKLARKNKKGKKDISRVNGPVSEEDKKYYRDHGTAKEVYAIKDQLTPKELGDALTRLNNEKKIADLIPKEKTAKDFIDDAVKMATTVNTAWETVNKLATNAKTSKKILDEFKGPKDKKSNDTAKNAAAKPKSEPSASDMISDIMKKAYGATSYEDYMSKSSSNIDLNTARDMSMLEDLLNRAMDPNHGKKKVKGNGFTLEF